MGDLSLGSVHLYCVLCCMYITVAGNGACGGDGGERD